jgi:hypothetical protein
MGLLFSAEARIGYDQVVAIAGIGYRGVAGFEGSLFAADAVLMEVHGTPPDHSVHNVFSLEGFELQEPFLVHVNA